MTDKRFDLITALYAFCCDYHSGQWSRGYKILSRIQSRYQPRNLPDCEEIESNDEWCGAKEFLEELKANYANKV